ncbi:glycosyltransferase family 39 protein [Waterburya agarophytonicola K14]|uniref:Glycosyltransferase family 39 protein n=1 Tax=Waterburya agarophytonicola KI4 TaxID=2874699 RepID=A0A964FE53_9CYAN|nr:glycosyltransferase family 39 protein [Waterburya agarophytonicola]MCC0175766.1 glycosyltransferase family 39 protein [Waterburya agarophytonicola KI4]
MRFTIKNLHWIDILILGLTLIVTLLGIGNYGLYEPHEGHFAMVGQEMLWRNDWITPHLNGAPYLNKPPLLYWSIATSIRIFGSTEFSARFPIAFSGWLGIIIAWKWTRELWGISSSRIAALMLSVTLGWFIFTHQILIDVLLGTLLLSSSYFLWKCLYQPRSWFNWFGAYISLALCVLTKGLIGGVFPLVSCIALVVARQDWKIIKRIKLHRGLLLVVAIVLPWFMAIEQANPGFLHYFIVNEHFDRLLDRRFPPDYEVSKISAVGYLAITACWCLPWILFLPSVVKFTWKEWRRGFLDNASILDRKNSDGIFLLAIGVILPIILFLPLSSRLIYYSIPAIPPYVMLCAGWWDQRSRQSLITNQASTVIDYPRSDTNPPIAYSSTVSTLCQSTVQIVNCPIQTKTLNLYGAIAIIFGIGCYTLILFLPVITNLLPTVLQTTEIVWLIIIVAISLGTGWLISGIGMLRRSSLAWLPLFIVLAITYIATIRGFALYQDIRSSKSIVSQANTCLSADTLWIFEGSREIGAAGAISYYLNQNRDGNLISPKDNSYRTVMVLADGGKNRLPPQFPGSLPKYLVTQAQLKQYWYRDIPVVFITDFLRQPNDLDDPFEINLPQANIQPYAIEGQRRLYLNQAARAIVHRQCNQ